MYKKVYIDDERFPKLSDNWIIVRNFKQFKNEIKLNGIPDEISFDHDLGEDEPTGYDILKWMVYDKEIDLRKIKINVHSANTVGKRNIEGLIKSYIKFLNENN